MLFICAVSSILVPLCVEVYIAFDFVERCSDSSGTPIVDEVGGDGTSILCHRSGNSVRLRRIGDVVCLDDDCSGFTPINKDFFERVKEHRNRIDRVSGSADVFTIEGIKPNTLLWMAFEGSEEISRVVESLGSLMESRWMLSKIARNGKPPAMKASKIGVDTMRKR